MNFRLSQEEEAFRGEVMAFLDAELPAGWIGPMSYYDVIESDQMWDFSRLMARKLGRRGWLALSWPKEYGGLASSYVNQSVFSEEMSYHRAPGVDVFGVRFVAPTIIALGSDAQKREHLPRIALGEVTWCEGFSEPEAGSDLASLQTRAVENGDCFVVSGQKVWTSGAHRSEWCVLLARTDETAAKHKGISLFLVDMKTPGICVRPLMNMLGVHSFNEVFFDEVKVPKENLLGQRDQGWQAVMLLLSFERSYTDQVASARRDLEELIDFFKESGTSSCSAITHSLMRQRLAELAIEVEVARLLAYRVAWMQQKGLPPGHVSSLLRVHTSEVRQRIASTGMQMLGLYGQLDSDSKWAPMKGRFEHYYLHSRCLTTAGGTSEIQRTIIAARGLGLPRA